MSTTEPRVEPRQDRRSVLPWRRHHVDVEVAPLVAVYRERHRRADTQLIESAFTVARTAHAEQVRRSGEPYIAHPLGVAMILADLGLDDVTIAAALLHDAVEDTTLTGADLEARFGADVAAIVDGVTKLDRIQFNTKAEQQSATLRKMLVAMAKDIRVLLIKLADRLHNMRTIASLPDAKQQRIAQETLDIYAPLAHRLGIADVKWQLEDLAFAVLHPKRYAEIEQMVAVQSPQRDEYLAGVVSELRARLAELGIAGEVSGRPKHYWSIYEKMVVRGKELDDVQDLVGVRVIVDSVKDCYGALGSIHAMWRPVQGRFKDYIAMPKFNLYQSLHTTVVGPEGKPVEVQIRTEEMHRRAEYGIAAHWGYKEQTSPAEDLAWLQRMVDWQQETSDPTEFMESLKIDLEQDEVFVFTPKGKVITLPSGGTAIDFAYTDPHRGRAPVHRRQGQRPAGPARFRARRRVTPSRSSPARSRAPARAATGSSSCRRRERGSKIRQWFSRERREDAIETGKDELGKALRKEGLPVQKLASSAAVGGGGGGDELRGPRRAVRRHRRGARLAPYGRPAHSARPARGRGAAAGHRSPPAPSPPAADGRCARRGPRRRHGATVALLHPGAGRRDHGLRHPRPGRLGAPHRLRQRRRSRHPRAAADRGGVGPRPARHLCRVGRSRGARPVEAAARRRLGAVRSPRQHPRLHVADVERPGGEASLRLRARRPEPSRLDPHGDQAHRLGVRGVPRAAGQGDEHGLAGSQGQPRGGRYRMRVRCRRNSPDVFRAARSGDARHPAARDRSLDRGRDRVRAPRRPDTGTASSSRRCSSTVEVFQRVGESTDVVRKEMYEFADKGGRPMALRPEGTAPVVRGVRAAPADAAVEGLVRRAAVPLRAPAEGPVPPALAAGGRGAGRRRPRGRRRGDRAARGVPAGAGA